MIKDKKLKQIANFLVTNDTDYMTAFRHNVLLYISDNEITINDLAEWSDLSVDTLKSFLYKNLKDCKLSTAVALARALNISIDELVGANTFQPLTRESLSICRNLPENALYLVRWFIKHQQKLCTQVTKGTKAVSIMHAQCAYNGNLKITNEYTTLDITNLSKEIVGKIFLGIQIPCDHYMPHYSPYDILLVANDRLPLHHEVSAVIVDGNLFFGRRKVENGIAKYYSIRDGKFRSDEKDVDEIVGYICYVYQDKT